MRILIILLMLSGLCYAEEESLFVNDAHCIYYDQKDNWIISNDFIKRLELRPEDRLNKKGSTIVVQGEDGNIYDWAYVLKRHMDWVDGRTR